MKNKLQIRAKIFVLHYQEKFQKKKKKNDGLTR